LLQAANSPLNERDRSKNAAAGQKPSQTEASIDNFRANEENTRATNSALNAARRLNDAAALSKPKQTEPKHDASANSPASSNFDNRLDQLEKKVDLILESLKALSGKPSGH
jgi:hypothetical protein